jgi:hypothetical protein
VHEGPFLEDLPLEGMDFSEGPEMAPSPSRSLDPLELEVKALAEFRAEESKADFVKSICHDPHRLHQDLTTTENKNEFSIVIGQQRTLFYSFGAAS